MIVEFVGRNLRVRWSENPLNAGIGVRGYQLEFDGTDGTITHFVDASKFQSEIGGVRNYADTLLFEDLLSVGVTRSVVVRLKSQSSSGKFSAPVTITAQNPAPELSAPTITPSFSGFDVRITAPNARDLAGYIIAVGTSSSFAHTNPVNWVHNGPDTSVVVALPDTTIRYVRVAAYDVFGTDALIWTTAQSVMKMTSDLSEIVSGVDELHDQVAVLNADAIINAQLLVDAAEQNIKTQLNLDDQVDYWIDLGHLEGIPIGSIVEETRTKTDELVEVQNRYLVKTADGLGVSIDLTKVMVGPTESLSQRLNTIAADTGADVSAAIEDLNQALTTKINAEATARQTLQTDFEGNLASAVSTTKAYSDNKLTTTLNSYATLSLVNGNKSAADSSISTLTTNLSAEVTARIQLATTVGNNKSSADSSISTLTTNLAAEVTARTNLATTVGTNKSNADAQLLVLTTAKDAQASQLSTLQTTVAGHTATIATNDTAFTTEKAAQATRNSVIDAKFNGTTSSTIYTAAQAAATQASAVATTLNQMGVTIGQGSAWAIDSNKVSVSATESLATRLTSINSEMGTKATPSYVSAQISTAISTATGPGSSIATSLSNLSSTVGGQTASITTLQQVQNGNSALYGWSLNSGGIAVGMKALNNGSAGTNAIIFSTDNFYVNTPGGNLPLLAISNGRMVFTGNVDINGNLIVSGSITTNGIAIGAVSSTVATSGNYNGGFGNSGNTAQVATLTLVSTGKPILISGMYSGMLVSGPSWINATGIITRNGTTILESAAYAPRSGRYTLPFQIVDNPGPGTWTYNIHDTVGTGGYNAFYFYALSATELKV
uniref:Fibronectin type III domain protein n=1 Tax=Caulobacter sp. (strain K31) TaxID=366602 RepID=B0T645_CAUSK